MPVDTELHKAAHNGDLGKVKELIETGEVDVNAPGAAERRPLHRAAGGNNVEIMNYLLEKGAPVDQVDKSGRTALHWSCISGHKEATEVLLARDPNLLAQTSSGATPFAAASEGGRVEVVKICMEKAAALGKLEEMCNLKDGAEKTAFDLAAAGQHKVVCKLLKDMGDPNAQSAACTIS
ncbi:unnamed protein product [Choristocarpus tenellus]